MDATTIVTAAVFVGIIVGVVASVLIFAVTSGVFALAERRTRHSLHRVAPAVDSTELVREPVPAHRTAA